jgi:hypothetical protein
MGKYYHSCLLFGLFGRLLSAFEQYVAMEREKDSNLDPMRPGMHPVQWLLPLIIRTSFDEIPCYIFLLANQLPFPPLPSLGTLVI